MAQINNPGQPFDVFEKSKCVKTLYSGKCFGEVAMMNNTLRTGSIICSGNTKTHLAYLTKSAYKDIM